MVWVFIGLGRRFSSGVFQDKEAAAKWISKYKLSGVLTQYPIGKGVYEWAIDNKVFEPRKDHESSPEFIQSFTCAAQEHYHFENGEVE